MAVRPRLDRKAPRLRRNGALVSYGTKRGSASGVACNAAPRRSVILATRHAGHGAGPAGAILLVLRTRERLARCGGLDQGGILAILLVVVVIVAVIPTLALVLGFGWKVFELELALGTLAGNQNADGT